jgi:Flp pilus assembly protein TadB
MTDEQNQPEPKRKRHYSSGHSGGSGRRRSSSRKPRSSGNKITVGQVLLLIWSIGAMFAFLWMLEDEQHAPLSVVIALSLATVVGLLLFFRTLRKKK